MPAEFAAEQHQCIVQEAALLQVGQERRRGLINGGAVGLQALVQVAVVVPARLADLDEADAGLAEPACHQALPGEGAAGPGLDAVGFPHAVRFPRDVQKLRDLALHPERQFVRLDHAIDGVGSGGAGGQVAVHGLDQVELPALQRRWRAGLEVGQIAQVVDARALEVGRQEGAAVVDGAAEVGGRVDGDVAWQVLVLGAEPIEEPGAHDWVE